MSNNNTSSGQWPVKHGIMRRERLIVEGVIVIDYVKSIINGVDRRYLVKNYIIAIVLSFLVFSGGVDVLTMLFVIVSAALFPFSALVWDELMNLMMGGNFIILPLPIMLVWKLFKLLLLFLFAFIIAPVGIAYIAIRNKYA